jgi:hypothetical protein
MTPAQLLRHKHENSHHWCGRKGAVTSRSARSLAWLWHGGLARAAGHKYRRSSLGVAIAPSITQLNAVDAVRIES